MTYTDTECKICGGMLIRTGQYQSNLAEYQCSCCGYKYYIYQKPCTSDNCFCTRNCRKNYIDTNTPITIIYKHY